jgi:predicted phosphodiesterase
MELLTSNLPSTHRVLFVGDLHYGSLAGHQKGWKKVLNRLFTEENTFVVLMGDLLESIMVDDPRFSTDVHDAREVPMMLAETLAADLDPVHKKVLAVLTGNHELKLIKFGNLTKMICRMAEVPYGGFCSKIQITTPSDHYKIFATHGNLSVRSRADDPLRRRVNEELMVKRRLQGLAGDCAVMATGHCHKLITVKPTHELFMTDKDGHLIAQYTKGVQNGDYIDPNLRWYMSTGSFLKTNLIGGITYSERFMLDPVQLGYAELVVEDGKIVRADEIYL